MTPDWLMIACASYWADRGCIDVRAVAMVTAAQCIKARSIFRLQERTFSVVFCIAPDGTVLGLEGTKPPYWADPNDLRYDKTK